MHYEGGQMSAKKVVLALAVCLSLANPAAGQEATKKPAATPTTARITFQGGTLDAYVDVVRKQFPNSNIHTDGGVGTIKLQAVSFPRVTLRSALEWVPRTAEARQKNLVLQPPVAAREGDVVFVLTTAQVAPLRQTPDPTELQLKAYNFSEDVRPGLPPDEVIRFVQSRLKTRRPPFEGPVEYDAKLRTVTVMGTSNDLRAADILVEELTRGQRVAAVLPRLQAEIKALQERIDRLEARKPAAK
jgi:hypothetical protein